MSVILRKNRSRQNSGKVIKIVFVGEVGDLSQIGSSEVGQMQLNPNYILKMTTIGVADRPDVWSEEKRKIKANLRCKCLQIEK